MVHVTGRTGTIAAGVVAAGAAVAVLAVFGPGVVDSWRAPAPVPAPTSTTISAPGSPSGSLVLTTAPAPGARSPTAAAAVLPAAAGRAPAGPAVAAALSSLLDARALGSSISVDVIDAAGGNVLLRRDADAVRAPASTVKLFTAAAALTALGPQSTIDTRVVAGTSPDRIVLVGGGDVLLGAGAGDPQAVDGHAGLADLAADTAAALRARGVQTVSLALDDTAFAAPARSPRWGSGDVPSGYVAPVHAIEVDAGRVAKGHYAARSPDPARLAADRFAAALRAAGIPVAGELTRAPAGDGAAELARVSSAPIGDVVEYMLTESDNTVAEALARLVAARTGSPTTFDGAGAAVLAQVRDLGVPAAGATMSDGSGLGAGTRVSAASLTAVLALAAGTDHPQLRPILSGLPVSRLTGTLLDRFEAPSQAATAGVVRAKTGSLTGVSALAGTVVDADGRLIVFAVLADRTGPTDPARRALDAVATALARCGCR